MTNTNANELARHIHGFSNAIVYVTLRCNLACPRCYLRHLPGTKHDTCMLPHQWQDILDSWERQDIHIHDLAITGGEPTLWPHLAWAIARAKSTGRVDRIRVVTNGVDRTANDYGDADAVQISHYGGINRYDIMRLKRELGRRAIVRSVMHFPWPFDSVPEHNTPPDCGCISLAYRGPRVYPCALQAAIGAGNAGYAVTDRYYWALMNGSPYTALCRTCLNNRKNVPRESEGCFAEYSIIDSRHYRVLDLSLFGRWFRRRSRKRWRTEGRDSKTPTGQHK